MLLLKGTVTAFAGLASLPVIQHSLVEQYHVLTNEQLNEAVKENRAGLKGVISNVNAITGDSRPQIAEILTNIKQVTDDVRKMTANAPAPGPDGKTPPGGEIRSTVERINRASASLESTLAHADVVIRTHPRAGSLFRGNQVGTRAVAYSSCVPRFVPATTS